MGITGIRVVDSFTEELPVEFCDVGYDGCKNANCDEAIAKAEATGEPIQNLCSCTTARAPSIPGNPKRVTVDIFWKQLIATPSNCEKRFGISALKADGKNTMICLKIPAK